MPNNNAYDEHSKIVVNMISDSFFENKQAISNKQHSAIFPININKYCTILHVYRLRISDIRFRRKQIEHT